jgi:hypothetical protein
VTPLREILEQPDSAPAPAEPVEVSLGDGVALVRKALADAATPPRWPMYPRQFKQFLKNAQPDFDERRYGSINDLMRACQKDGLVRLERDRQGGLRVFASNGPARASVPHGWGLHQGNGGNGHDAATLQDATADEAVVEAIAEQLPPPVIEAQVTEVIEERAEKPRRSSRARKTSITAEKKKAAPRKKKPGV